jgi:hypothetical protein
VLLECKVVRNTVSSLNEPVSLDYSHKWVGRPRRSIGDTQQLSLSVFHFELRPRCNNSHCNMHHCSGGMTCELTGAVLTAPSNASGAAGEAHH